MRLYLLRHADALPGADDAQRPLSPRGEQECRCLAKFLERAGIEFEAAYTSPLLRARQTAERVLATCRAREDLQAVVSDKLLNETSANAFTDWLGRLSAAKHVLLVGHMPSLAERLCALLEVEPSAAFRLPKAGLAALARDESGTVTLKLFVSPKVLGLK